MLAAEEGVCDVTTDQACRCDLSVSLLSTTSTDHGSPRDMKRHAVCTPSEKLNVLCEYTLSQAALRGGLQGSPREAALHGGLQGSGSEVA